MVDLERAADTLRDLARPQHEMLDEELTAAFEQIRERHFPFRSVEDVLLLDPDPRQGTALPVHLVPLAGQVLLALEQLQALVEPLGARHDAMRLHGQFPSSVLVRGVRFLRSALASHATRPPVEVEPTTASVMVEMHAGHMACSPFTSLSNGRGPDRHRPSGRWRRWRSGVASAIAPSTSTRVPVRRASSSMSSAGLWCMPLDPSRGDTTRQPSGAPIQRSHGRGPGAPCERPDVDGP